MVRSTINGLNDRQILLVTVEGRQPGKSIGMSLTMLADLFIEFSAVEAINLDGDGSTTMVIRNKVVNKPSDATGERPVRTVSSSSRDRESRKEGRDARPGLCYFQVVW